MSFSAALRDRAPRLRGQGLLRAIAEGTAGAVGEDFLRGLVRTMAEASGAKLAFVGEATRDDGAHVRIVAGWYDGDPIPEDQIAIDSSALSCAE